MGSHHLLGSRVGHLRAVFLLRKKPKKSNMSVNEAEARKICEIYDWDGTGKLYMYYFMDIFYALGMNIAKKVTVKFGQTDDTGKKFCTFDEVIKLMNEAVKEPEHSGNYHDYVELCKLYDKNENGTMMLAELENILCNLADEIPKEDCQKMFEELAPKEDEDGMIPYTAFIDKLCGKAKFGLKSDAVPLQLLRRIQKIGNVDFENKLKNFKTYSMTILLVNFSNSSKNNLCKN